MASSSNRNGNFKQLKAMLCSRASFYLKPLCQKSYESWGNLIRCCIFILQKSLRNLNFIRTSNRSQSTNCFRFISENVSCFSPSSDFVAYSLLPSIRFVFFFCFRSQTLYYNIHSNSLQYLKKIRLNLLVLPLRIYSPFSGSLKMP